MFKDTMEKIGQPCIPSKVVTTVEDADGLRPGASAIPSSSGPPSPWAAPAAASSNNEEELREIAANGLRAVPHHPDPGGKVHLRLEGNRV